MALRSELYNIHNVIIDPDESVGVMRAECNEELPDRKFKPEMHQRKVLINFSADLLVYERCHY